MNKNVFGWLLFLLSTIGLLGCQNSTSTPLEETKTIIVEEKQTYATVIGIENGSVSPFNTLIDFEEIDKLLAEKYNSNIVHPEEIEYGGTVYVEEEYYEHIQETEPSLDISQGSDEERYISMGTFDITAYTWTGNPMANGEYPYEGCIASSDFAIGTVLHIDGIGTYVVKDRCPTSGVIDIYMDSYDACIQFGRQYRTVYIVQ